MTEWLPILLFTISTTLTPGPNNFMIMNSGLNFGIKRSLPHLFGICFGFPLMMLIIALGFGAIFIKYDWIKEVLKYIGSAYMLYLSWKIAFAKVDVNSPSALKPLTFIQAMMFQWVNPKAWLMAIGAISIFSITTNYFFNAIALSHLFLLVCIPCIAIWLVFGAFLRNILKEPKHQKWFNIGMALLLAGSIVLIFVD